LQQPLAAEPEQAQQQQQQHLHRKEHLQPQLLMTAQAVRKLLLSMAVLLWVAVSLLVLQAQQALADLQR
jgi:hypothetical protein